MELPREAGEPEGMCGKLNYWLYGFRPAAAAWENLYSGLLCGVGFERGESCGVVFYHPERDLSLAAHGDDFTFSFPRAAHDMYRVYAFGFDVLDDLVCVYVLLTTLLSIHELRWTFLVCRSYFSFSCFNLL